MYPLKIGRTKSCFFTKTQKNKIETGIQIFLESIKHKSFAESILQFQWNNHENKRFHRFYHASGLSNRQVLERITNFQQYFEELGFQKQIVLLPFGCRKEIESYQSFNNPMIWISMNCINNDWYTPIHIASAICHEMTLQLGLDSSASQFSRPEYKIHSVPEFTGKLILQTAALWKNSISEIENAFDAIDENQYNYFPASKILGNVNPISIQHNQASFETLISTLLIEQETLIALQDDLTISETTRLVCIEEVLLKLNKLKGQLAACSLDGSELDFQPTNITPGSRRSN